MRELVLERVKELLLIETENGQMYADDPDSYDEYNDLDLLNVYEEMLKNGPP